MRPEQSSFIQSYDQLPDTLAIFPLHDTVLLPGANLPLNIFEPRYLNMVQDAMSGNRLIGMIQPCGDSNSSELCEVGCAGRITHYIETHDERLEIILEGICRFRITEEIPTNRGYRRVKPDWSAFAGDYDEPTVDDNLVKTFRAALRHYLDAQDINPDYEKMDKLEAEILIDQLAMALPIAATDKQLLIEAPNLQQRTQLFNALISSAQGSGVTRH